MSEQPDGRILSPNGKAAFFDPSWGLMANAAQPEGSFCLAVNSATHEMAGGAGEGTRLPFLVMFHDMLARAGSAGDTIAFEELPRVSWHSIR